MPALSMPRVRSWDNECPPLARNWRAARMSPIGYKVSRDEAPSGVSACAMTRSAGPA